MKPNVFRFYKVASLRAAILDLPTFLVWIVSFVLSTVTTSLFRQDAFYNGMGYEFSMSLVSAFIVTVIADVYLCLRSRDRLVNLLPISPKQEAKYYFRMIFGRLLLCLLVIGLFGASVCFFTTKRDQQMITREQLLGWRPVYWFLLNLLGICSVSPVLLIPKKVWKQMLALLIGQIVYVGILVGFNTCLMGGKLTVSYRPIGRREIALSDESAWMVMGIIAIFCFALIAMFRYLFVKRVKAKYASREVHCE